MKKVDRERERTLFGEYESIIDPLECYDYASFIQWRGHMIQIVRQHLKNYNIHTKHVLAAINNLPRYMGNIFIQYISLEWERKDFPYMKPSIDELKTRNSLSYTLIDGELDIERVINTVYAEIDRRFAENPITDEKLDPWISSDELGLPMRIRRFLLRGLGNQDMRCTEFIEKVTYQDLMTMKGIGEKSVRIVLKRFRTLGYLIK